MHDALGKTLTTLAEVIASAVKQDHRREVPARSAATEALPYNTRGIASDELM